MVTNGLVTALQFLTILPAGKARPFWPQKMMPYFPVVGLIIGGLLAGFDAVVAQWWPRPAAAVLDVLFLVVVTGAFHLDGLADTADGFYGGHSAQTALAIMKDSRVGAIGVVAIVGGLAIKWAGLASLADHRQWILIVVPSYARAGMLAGIRFLPYGRPEGGTGQAFFDSPLKASSFWGLLPAAVLSGLLGWKGVWLNACFVLLTAAVLFFYRRRLGCITGDMLGASGEICESGLFLLMATGGAL
jgi:adenosylcobinamide-GDP ribazoletransferase